MRIAVAFQDESLDFEAPDERVAGVWAGPRGVPPGEVGDLVRAALEHPRAFPALRRAVVPGDRVVVPIDPTVPEPGAILAALAGVFAAAGVEPGDLLALATGPLDPAEAGGMKVAVHDPDDRPQLAYLAATATGRRVYLNRHLTDADLVVPVGRLGFDPVLGHGGPWGTVFPGVSDAETIRAFRALASGDPLAVGKQDQALAESAEVSWLLGCQFHVGVVPGATGGMVEVVAGQDAAVRAEGIAAADAAWTYRAEDRAELVVAGVGVPGQAATLDDLAAALAAAAGAVRRGGKIVALSRAAGPLGPSFQRLAGATEARPGVAALRKAEGEADYPAALRVAQALAWADVYLLSALPDQEVEDLGMIPLGRPEEARRLVAISSSSLFLGHADRTRTAVGGEED